MACVGIVGCWGRVDWTLDGNMSRCFYVCMYVCMSCMYVCHVRASLCRFNPLAPLKKTWDLVLMFVILYSVIIVPYRISFDVEVRDRERPPPRPPRRETQPVPRTPSSSGSTAIRGTDSRCVLQAEGVEDVVDILFDIFFAADIVLNFMTMYASAVPASRFLYCSERIINRNQS